MLPHGEQALLKKVIKRAYFFVDLPHHLVTPRRWIEGISLPSPLISKAQSRRDASIRPRRSPPTEPMTSSDVVSRRAPWLLPFYRWPRS
jgi:hypothetical protein